MQYCTLMNNTQGLFSVGHGKHFEKVRQVDKLKETATLTNTMFYVKDLNKP